MCVLTFVLIVVVIIITIIIADDVCTEVCWFPLAVDESEDLTDTST